MTIYPAMSTQQPAAICALKSPADAILILEAVRIGLIPRVTRRLTGHERAMIRPGTVWVWEEEETNMRRWTDGRRWGASRVSGGGFLVYTEAADNLSPPPSRGSDYDPGYPHRSSLKPESLIKQTYSTTMTHPVTGTAKKFHVVAYSSKHNPQGDADKPLPLPYQLPLLATLKITPGLWPEWEHRRDADCNLRQESAAPVSLASGQTTPITAVASPVHADYRARSPSRSASRYLAPYPHVAPRDAYRRHTHPVPCSQERYYHETPRYPPHEYPVDLRYPPLYHYHPRGYPRHDAYFEDGYNSSTRTSSEDSRHAAYLAPSPTDPTGKSPTMSISNSIPNPSNSGPGLTLPPLRLVIDEHVQYATSPNRRRGSPRSDNSDSSIKGEDARQLGELGKTVCL